MKGFTQITLSALVALASSTAIKVSKRESPLSVKLTPSGNSEVKVAVTNNGDTGVNLLSKGTFLDETNPVQKVQMYSANKEIPFEGVKLTLLRSGLTEDAFTYLGAGETKEVTVETAALHTLNDGGDFDVFANGQIPYAEANSTDLVGAFHYESDKLSMNIDGAKAAKVSKTIVQKRTDIKSDCSGTKLSAVKTGLTNCQKLASAAATAAKATTKLDTYFKSTSSSVANTVSARLTAVSNECGGTTSATETHCTDTYSACSSNVLAYTVPSQDYVVYCNLFFSDLPALATKCHGQDQATTILHELTHAPGVYSPGTDDLGYGYAAATKLSSQQALNNADSYALYANAINLNC